MRLFQFDMPAISQFDINNLTLANLVGVKCSRCANQIFHWCISNPCFEPCEAGQHLYRQIGRVLRGKIIGIWHFLLPNVGSQQAEKPTPHPQS